MLVTLELLGLWTSFVIAGHTLLVKTTADTQTLVVDRSYLKLFK